MDAVQPLLRELLGHAMRRERHAQGMTLSQVATRSGVSIQHLSDVERGRKDPSSEVLAAITGALGLSVTDLAARIVRSATGQHEMTSAVRARTAETRRRRGQDLASDGHRAPRTHVAAGLASSVPEVAEARTSLPVDAPAAAVTPEPRVVLDLTRARRQASSQHPTQVPPDGQASAQVTALARARPHSRPDALARPGILDQSRATLAAHPLAGTPLTGPLLAAA